MRCDADGSEDIGDTIRDCCACPSWLLKNSSKWSVGAAVADTDPSVFCTPGI